MIYCSCASAQNNSGGAFMSLKRLFILVLAILMLATCALAEEYTPAAAAAEWKTEDFNGTWHIFYRIDDGAGSSTRESAFQITLVIDGESAVNTFTYPDGENNTNCTLDYADSVTLTYDGGQTADVTLLEDGTLQVYMPATTDTMETTMFFEKVEP